MELGKRLNILREQFGREQSARLEETYKQSREEGEEEETEERKSGDISGRNEVAIKHNEDKGEREGTGEMRDRSGRNGLVSTKKADTVKDEPEGENNVR